MQNSSGKLRKATATDICGYRFEVVSSRNMAESRTHPKTGGILESALYVTDVGRSAQFYKNIFGFRVISDFGDRGCAMESGASQLLLLFRKGGSRDIPTPHDGE
jgi:catechol-2,3-dioxygenase